MTRSVWDLSDQEMQDMDLGDFGMQILAAMSRPPQKQSVYNLRLNLEGVSRPDSTLEGVRAFAEALSWLQNEGLIASAWDPGVPSPDWVFITRKGCARLDQDQLGSGSK